MASIKYLVRVIHGAQWEKMQTTIQRVHEKSGKNKIIIFFDMLNCAIFHGAGYHDYLIFGLWDTNFSQRKTFITRLRNKKMMMMLNDENYSHLFDNKEEFNALFGEKFLFRPWLDTHLMSKDDFHQLIEQSPIIFAKPSCGESGKGIEKLDLADFSDVDALYKYVINPEKNFRVIEGLLVQHPDMARLYPPAVNALRVVTLVDNYGNAHCMYVTCKMGNLGKYVDNMENDGLACPVDMSTGKICGVAHTSALINYDAHPYTGVKLLGYQIPYFREAVELCCEAAKVVPQIRYIGWDVCIMPNGPAIIEGNNYPAYDFCQLPEHTPERIGMWAAYKKIIPQL